MATPDFSKVWASNSPLPAYTFSDADYQTGWDFVGSAPPTKNEFDAWFKLVDTKLNWLYSQLQTTASKLYPVGSVYISFNSTSPATLFGGTWTRLKDRVLMASGDTYAPNTTGGSATVTLTTNQLPAHKHSISTNGTHLHNATATANGNHNHSVTGTVNTAGNHTHTWSGTSTSAGSHTHTWSGATASAGSHTHPINASTTSAGTHTHTRGSMEINGGITATDTSGDYPEALIYADVITQSGALKLSNTKTIKAWRIDDENQNTTYNTLTFKASDGWTGETSSNGVHTHTVTISMTSAGVHTHTLSGSNATNGVHTHTLSGSNETNGGHTHTWSGAVANNGTHTHSISMDSRGSHTHTIGNTGGGLPVNVLNPYQTVYMWRRTA